MKTFNPAYILRRLLLLLVFGLLLLWGLNMNGQTPVKIDSSGNFTSASPVKESKQQSLDTGKLYTDSKGNQYPVYCSASGRLFILRTSKKTGNIYKQYLTLK